MTQGCPSRCVAPRAFVTRCFGHYRSRSVATQFRKNETSRWRARSAWARGFSFDFRLTGSGLMRRRRDEPEDSLSHQQFRRNDLDRSGLGRSERAARRRHHPPCWRGPARTPVVRDVRIKPRRQVLPLCDSAAPDALQRGPSCSRARLVGHVAKQAAFANWAHDGKTDNEAEILRPRSSNRHSQSNLNSSDEEMGAARKRCPRLFPTRCAATTLSSVSYKMQIPLLRTARAPVRQTRQISSRLECLSEQVTAHPSRQRLGRDRPRTRPPHRTDSIFRFIYAYAGERLTKRHTPQTGVVSK